MIKRTIILVVFTLITANIFAQNKTKIDLLSSKSKVENIVQNKSDNIGFKIKEEIPNIEFKEIETKEGTYIQLSSDGMYKSYDLGKPNLPVTSRLIEIPLNFKAVVKVLTYDEKIIELKNYNLLKQIIPAQASLSKIDDPKDVPFYKNKSIYKRDKFFKNDIVKLEDIGYLRNKHLAYVEISPFQYNPVTNTLKVLNNIEIEINFIPDSKAKHINTKSLKSPYYKNIVKTTNQLSEPKALISGPVKYVIVSDRMFEQALQPFIQWKTMKGFNVVEAYTDDSSVGNTTTSIKAYLKNLYENPSDGIAPTFVLLVGDVAQIPTFSGTAGGHYTDLYYFEYTGDKLPEVFYGRFSAESLAELQPQIDKTLEIEKYEMPNPSYLNNVVLVAGVDASNAPTYGNGAINYANSYYTNTENGVTSYYYLYNDDSGVMSSNNSGASASIRSYISEGVSFVNYTAHCSSSGWADPSFSISHIDGLTNEHMYPLIIGNCCESNTFYNNDCFGEKILMAANKGAVGYIGGSNSTYWDEDYYWGVGLASISANPTYENSGLGAYDRYFHLKGEAKEDWYVTQGQINVAGNLAVEASSSSRKAYYWEIYHLMGDPSLTPYVTVPEILTASYDSEVIIGTSNLQVLTEEDAYVAISLEGELLDAQLVDATGVVDLAFSSLTNVGELDIVITKQNRQPKIDKINIIPATTPYIVLNNFVIDDNLENANGEADFNESVKLDVKLENVSEEYDAFLVNATLTSVDTNIIITDSLETYGTILKSDSLLITSAFEIEIKSKIKNQHTVLFNLKTTGKDSEGKSYEWNSHFNITLNAPQIEIGDLFIDDSSGDNDNILDPGETADICLLISNTGNASISNLSGITTLLGNSSLYLTLNNSELTNISLDAQQTDTLRFSATADSSTPIGTSVYLNFNIKDINYSFYSKTKDKEVCIGEIPEVLISQGDTVITNNSLFYDSGGKTANYSNNENYTITFTPEDTNTYLMVNFLSFGVEPDGSGCYDYLKIYDGESTSATLVGSYCSANKPTTIIATNESGSLTFQFSSDGSVSQSGWEAEIKGFVGYNYQTTISDTKGLIEGASVELDDRTETTGADGIAKFYNVPEGINYLLKISAQYHEDYDTIINLFENTSEEINLGASKYEVRFNLSDEDGNTINGDITFDGRTLTTSDGIATFSDVEYSLNETYTIQSYGHIDTTASLVVNENLSKNIILKIVRHDIKFVISDGTDPIVGAYVDFDNKEISSSIDGIALFENVKMDTTLNYTVRKTGYKNLTGTLDSDKDSTLNLVMNPGVATFNVTFLVSFETKPIYNAQVILDKDTLYTNTTGVVVFKDLLEANDIPYKISKEHFNNILDTINIAGNNINIDTVLTYESYEIGFSINNGTNPIEGAIVSFDGKSGTSNSNGECTFDVIYSLNKEYHISKDKYHEVSGMINVDEGKTITKTMTLITYNVTFNVTDALSHVIENVLVVFNGENKNTNSNGEALFTEIPIADDINFALSKDGYWNYDSTINVVDTDVVFNAILSSTTSIVSINKENIRIYPNPSNGIFNLEINNAEKTNYSVKVFNILGSVIYNSPINGENIIKQKIDLTKYPKGMYFLSIESENENIVNRRIIIK